MPAYVPLFPRVHGVLERASSHGIALARTWAVAAISAGLERHREDGMLDRIRGLSDTMQGLLISVMLGLIVLGVVLLIQLIA